MYDSWHNQAWSFLFIKLEKKTQKITFHFHEENNIHFQRGKFNFTYCDANTGR